MDLRCPACGSLIAPTENTAAPAGCPHCGAATRTASPGFSTAPPIAPERVCTDSVPRLPEGDRKTLAKVAFAFAIPGICLFPLGLIALVLGGIARFKANRRPDVYGGGDLAGVSMVLGAVGVGIALVAALLLPSLRFAQELEKRTECVASMKAIATGFYVNEPISSSRWWTCDYPRFGGAVPAESSLDYTQAIGSYRSTDLEQTSITPNRLSTTRAFWKLIRTGSVTPKTLCCPSTVDDWNRDANPQTLFDFGSGVIAGPATPEQSRIGYSQISYGLQIPFGEFGRPESDMDGRVILLADKGPYGAAIENGSPVPPPFPATWPLKAEDIRPWNSPNHGGEGQIALFADSHAEFLNVPWGPFNDNIYTAWPASDSKEPFSKGRPPAPGLKLMPASNTDSLIYP